ANLALAEAYCIMQRDLADVMIVGATGSRVHSLRTIHVLKQEDVTRDPGEPATLSRPFDAGRTGMVLGEGAAALVLETLDHAQARGARVLGEIIGYASSTVTSREGVGCEQGAVTNAIRGALRCAGLAPDQVCHVHAHGLSTRAADRADAQAIASIFGPDFIPVTALQSDTGHVGAA